MISKLCRIGNTDYILMNNGNMKKANNLLVSMYLTEFKNLEKLDLFQTEESSWNDKCENIEEFKVDETYAYITDTRELVICNPVLFRKVMEEINNIDDYVTAEEYGKLNDKSYPQIKVFCQTGRLKTARKINGKAWVVNRFEAYPDDNRMTAGGKFCNIRNK